MKIIFVIYIQSRIVVTVRNRPITVDHSFYSQFLRLQPFTIKFTLIIFRIDLIFARKSMIISHVAVIRIKIVSTFGEGPDSWRVSKSHS